MERSCPGELRSGGDGEVGESRGTQGLERFRGRGPR